MLTRSRTLLLFDLNLFVQESLLVLLVRHLLLVGHAARREHSHRSSCRLHVIADGTIAIVEHVIEHVLALLHAGASSGRDVLLLLHRLMPRRRLAPLCERNQGLAVDLLGSPANALLAL